MLSREESPRAGVRWTDRREGSGACGQTPLCRLANGPFSWPPFLNVSLSPSSLAAGERLGAPPPPGNERWWPWGTCRSLAVGGRGPQLFSAAPEGRVSGLFMPLGGTSGTGVGRPLSPKFSSARPRHTSDSPVTLGAASSAAPGRPGDWSSLQGVGVGAQGSQQPRGSRGPARAAGSSSHPRLACPAAGSELLIPASAQPPAW